MTKISLLSMRFGLVATKAPESAPEASPPPAWVQRTGEALGFMVALAMVLSLAYWLF